MARLQELNYYNTPMSFAGTHEERLGHKEGSANKERRANNERRTSEEGSANHESTYKEKIRC